jgi:chaperone BCS1
MSSFIDTAKQERLTDLQNDINRYIYTYLGEDDEKNPIFEKELFKPYCKFDKLVGSVPKKIEESFDFFTSDDGREWYEKRNLPYQMTVLLYGIPGTGKSCIASAVATKFNLHIVRIKLSLIKTNYQFIKAFKNKVFCDTKIEYKNILYLFDELDTEQNSVLKNRTTPVSSKKVTFTKEDTPTSSLPTLEQKKELINKYSIKEDDLNNLLDNIFTGPKQTNQDSLTLGTILEELNGINQMYGRKMFIISNHPEKLDPAILRPGRIDLKYKLQHLSYCEIFELFSIFFPTSEYTTYEKEK